MPSPSNIYAEKAYSEHPIAMWALDDKLDYVSYISLDNGRNLESWIVSEDVSTSDEATITTENINLGQTLPDGLYKISSLKRDTEPLVGRTRLTSPTIFNFQDMDPELGTFSMGAYFYSDTEYINSITIGFLYNEEVTQQLVRVSKRFETNVYKNWMYIAETFDIPNFTSDVQLFIDIEYYDNEEPQTPYVFYVNGLSLGQWSEEFQSESLGLEYGNDIIDFPVDIALDGADKAVIARSYGLQDLNGYYLATANKIFAKNTSMPMVFGANGVTRLLYNNDLPSLIIPGNGMLSNVGKYSTYTLEAWLKIDSISTEPHRILGPLSSEDGVYVDHERFYLKLSNNVKTALVPEWGIPMLVHLKYTPGKMSLVVNTEELISITFDKNTTYLPDRLSASGKNQDWIGFYSANDVAVDVDCVGIYTYDIDKTLAKRKWVYGQNVEYPENLNSAFDGKTIAIDYRNANYAANFSFPKNSSWSAGISNNTRVLNNRLYSPQYQLPQLVLSSGSETAWLSDQLLNNFEGDQFFRMKPGTQWESINSYLYLDNLTLVGNDIQAVYGVFKRTYTSDAEQVLIKLRDRFSGKYLSMNSVGSDVVYKFYNGQSESTLKTVSSNILGEMFVAGIRIDSLSTYYGSELIQFFANKNSLEVYIAGDTSFSKTYLGNIYNFSIATKRNVNNISYMFGPDGTAIDKDYFENVIYDAGSTYFGNNSEYWSTVLDGGDPYAEMSAKFYSYVSAYKLVPTTFFGNFFLDVASYSTWEDYVPLSNFAKYVKDPNFGDYYDLDFIQFNIGYPSPGKLLEQKTKSSSWTYDELQAEFLSPVQYTYNELDNELVSGYASYDDLKNKTKSQYVYDTTEYAVKTYITFQNMSSGANTLIENYTNTENVSTNNLIQAGDEWVNTKYEVIDGTVIYPPKSVNFNSLAIVVHVEMTTMATRNKPVSVYNIELTSQALNYKTPTPVGTKFGIPFYPYTKTGLYFDYKKVNGFKMHKQGTPYLYLSRNSGVELVGDYEPLTNRGITVPLNSKVASKFNVAAIQTLIKYNKDFFPYSPTPIFEVQSKDSYIKFYLVATNSNGTRAKIYAINANTGAEENGLAFYINGRLVKSPTLSIKEWTMIGISFAQKLNLDGYSGAIRVNGPIMVNHISYYQSTGLQEKVLTTFRVWDRVKESLTNQELAWNFWRGTGSIVGTYSWNNVLVIGQSSFLGISLPEIFKAYVGTNKIIFDDNGKVTMSGYRFRTYRRTSSVSFVKKPS